MFLKTMFYEQCSSKTSIIRKSITYASYKKKINIDQYKIQTSGK